MAVQLSRSKAQYAYCSDLSRQAGETLFGTAPQVQTWLLLEYGQAWRNKATQDNALSQPVKAWLATTLEALSDPRLLFIKQPSQEAADGITFFVAIAHEMEPRLYRFRLNAYEDLLALDVAAILSGDSTFVDHLDEELLFLVCTNGKRDLCCARRGNSTYNRLRELAGNRVWQCTHVGAHRFAANCVYLPHGIYYGRVDDADLKTFVEDGRSQRANLAHYRGRSCYSAAGQVGEYFLRQQTGVTDLSRYHLKGIEIIEENRWIVEFTSPADHSYAVHIESVLSGWEEIASCGDIERRQVSQYHMAAFEVVEPTQRGKHGHLSTTDHST